MLLFAIKPKKHDLPPKIVCLNSNQTSSKSKNNPLMDYSNIDSEDSHRRSSSSFSYMDNSGF